MKLSARNILKGTIKEIKIGIINNEIVIQLLGGDEITSVITQTSSDRLGLEVGKPVSASYQGFQRYGSRKRITFVCKYVRTAGSGRAYHEHILCLFRSS